MPKPVVAIDVDDVLADSRERFRQEINVRHQLDLQPAHYAVPGEYWGYYERIWRELGIYESLALDDINASMKHHVLPHADAPAVLKRLSRDYDLVVVTARREKWQQLTRDWLERHFPDTFCDIHFAGNTNHTTHVTKGDMCAEVGAQWLIDDHVQHCRDAAERGVTPLLFGDYGWQQGVPMELVRCRDWLTVEGYFDGRA